MVRAVDFIPLIAGIVSAVFVFNLFYAYAPTPFVVQDVYTFAPKAYVYPDDQPQRIVANSEAFGNYRVVSYFYCWDYDAFIPKTDCEPVLLLISGNDVIAVSSRVHYQWRVLYVFPEEVGKPVVSFLYGWHTPLFREPSDEMVEVRTPIVVDELPEDIDYQKVFGFSPNPQESALAAAIIYGFLAGLGVFGVSSLIIKR